MDWKAVNIINRWTEAPKNFYQRMNNGVFYLVIALNIFNGCLKSNIQQV